MVTWLSLPKPWIFLAPMAGIADWAFREICYASGAEVAISHLVHVTGLIASPHQVVPEIEAKHGGRPFIVQLVGHRPEDFKQAARIVTDQLPAAGIDINMGCPVAPVVGAGGGSALLRDPMRAAAIVYATCGGTHLPVTVKLRSGWDRPVAPEIAPMLEAAGASALIVHGRTREQQYRGLPDLEVIAQVKRSVGIPVVGNGNVASVSGARRMLEVTGVDGIMVGRGALGNPWLFGSLQAELKGDYKYRQQSPSFGDLIRQHVKSAFANLGQGKAVRTIRRHLISYSAGRISGAKLRSEIPTLHNLDDIMRWIGRLEETESSVYSKS